MKVDVKRKNMFEKLKAFWQEIKSGMMVSKDKTVTMTIEELVKKAELMHPVGFYVLAIKLFKEGRKDESIKWFYVGSIRFRHFLSSIGDDHFDPENELFGKVQFEIGGSILDYAGGDPDFWAKQIEAADEWDDNHRNYFFSKRNNHEALVEIKDNMGKLVLKLQEEKDDIIRQRRENNAEVRV
jgi:hypothetical protein